MTLSGGAPGRPRLRRTKSREVAREPSGLMLKMGRGNTRIRRLRSETMQGEDRQKANKSLRWHAYGHAHKP